MFINIIILEFCMDEMEYNKLLDKAYSELPEVLYKSKRFEIPQVRGKLIKSRTVISNFRDITKQLSREEEPFSRFMLRELGVRGDISPRGELILHSRFQPAILNKGVEKFYKEYVQCEHCNSPDTEIVSDDTIIKCKACGHQKKIPKL